MTPRIQSINATSEHIRINWLETTKQRTKVYILQGQPGKSLHSNSKSRKTSIINIGGNLSTTDILSQLRKS